jgi:hypothetical protein
MASTFTPVFSQGLAIILFGEGLPNPPLPSTEEPALSEAERFPRGYLIREI